ncbi:hypothetical protein KA001_00785 [Patescibacteria group bacterium]|nr:hypothetical protein [Patescibacteria group bacterium]
MYPFLNVIYPPENLIIGEPSTVKEGVDCLVLSSLTKDGEDYGFIAIAPLVFTPEQPVWERHTITTEAFVFGRGTLVIERACGSVDFYSFTEASDAFSSVRVFFGDTMRWFNTSSTDFLFIFETCRPKYKDGRFLNLD